MSLVGAGATGPRPEAIAIIDLTVGVDWNARLEADRRLVAERAERQRARRAQEEAQRDLQRLRSRYWSGERLLDEGRGDVEWWAHPEADPYAVLELLPGVTLEEAATARRRIAQECHPDRLPADADREAAAARMTAANAAYDRIRRALLPR